MLPGTIVHLDHPNRNNIIFGINCRQLGAHTEDGAITTRNRSFIQQIKCANQFATRIDGTFNYKIISLSKEYSCILITGPRQVGKTTVLRQLMDDDREYVTLDDMEERGLAKRDPAMFLQLHSTPIMIDEVQYAPELFSYIKMEVDKGAARGTYWLTGSQAFKLMELAQESLAGRVAILHMSSLSQHEIYGSGNCAPFTLALGALKEREKTNAPANIPEIYDRIWKGSMPGLASGKLHLPGTTSGSANKITEQ